MQALLAAAEVRIRAQAPKMSGFRVSRAAGDLAYIISQFNASNPHAEISPDNIRTGGDTVNVLANKEIADERKSNVSLLLARVERERENVEKGGGKSSLGRFLAAAANYALARAEEDKEKISDAKAESGASGEYKTASAGATKIKDYSNDPTKEFSYSPYNEPYNPSQNPYIAAAHDRIVKDATYGDLPLPAGVRRDEERQATVLSPEALKKAFDRINGTKLQETPEQKLSREFQSLVKTTPKHGPLAQPPQAQASVRLPVDPKYAHLSSEQRTAQIILDKKLEESQPKNPDGTPNRSILSTLDALKEKPNLLLGLKKDGFLKNNPAVEEPKEKPDTPVSSNRFQDLLGPKKEPVNMSTPRNFSPINPDVKKNWPTYNKPDAKPENVPMVQVPAGDKKDAVAVTPLTVPQQPKKLASTAPQGPG